MPEYNCLSFSDERLFIVYIIDDHLKSQASFKLSSLKEVSWYFTWRIRN